MQANSQSWHKFAINSHVATVIRFGWAGGLCSSRENFGSTSLPRISSIHCTAQRLRNGICLGGDRLIRIIQDQFDFLHRPTSG